MQGPSFETISKFEQIKRFNEQIVVDRQIIGYEGTLKTDITAEKLFKVFIDELNDYSEVSEAIRQYS